MKHLLALTLIFAAGAASADEYCTEYHNTAAKVLEARYKGIPVTALMEVAGDDKILRQLVLDAYREPEFQVPKNRENHIRKFADQHYIICVEVRG